MKRIYPPEKAPSRLSPIRSMKTYIQERYEREMVLELAAKINSGEITASRMPRYRTSKAVADPETGHIQSISFRRLTPCYVHADIILEIVVTFPADDAQEEQCQFLSYRADFWIDLEDKIICDYGQFRCYTYEEPPEGCILSEYLVPFLSRDDMEEEAESILLRYCPEALHDPKLLNPWNLTHSLGLHISCYPLAYQDSVESISTSTNWITEKAISAFVLCNRTLSIRVNQTPTRVALKAFER